MSAEVNGVMLQGFHWFLKPNFPNSNGRSLWKFLKDEAEHFRNIGIDAVWIPPAYKAAFNRSNSVGYDVYDHFDLGEFTLPGEFDGRTKYGNKQELLEAVEALHGNGTNKRVQVYADVVLNHKVGGAEDGYWQAIRVDKENRNSEHWGDGFETGLIEIRTYTKFQHQERRGAYSTFEWSAKHFDSVDTAAKIRQNGLEFNDPQDKYIYRFIYNEEGYRPQQKQGFESWVSLEKGNYDYLTGCDFDYGRYDVREEMKYWGAWLANELKLDGVRLDAVKHISADYIQEWLGYVRWKTGKNLFAVAEYIAGDTNPLHNYIARVTTYGDYPQPVCLFDFPLRFKFGTASRLGEAYDLKDLNSGTLMAEQSALAVTFVENHDYEYGRAYESHVEEWFKPLAYAFILLRKNGYPCVFFPDYYGSLDWDEPERRWHRAQKPGRDYLNLLLKLRKQFALGEERYYSDKNVAGWIRMGFVSGAKGAMAVVINNSYGTVKSIRMNTGRFSKRFYHLATIKLTNEGFLVVRNRYDLYGDKAEGLWTDSNGWGDFLADGSTAAIWIEDGVGLTD
ncbi:alpha-amylase [Nostoc sp. FACHB-145]|uniref:alpha-amylase n=1 Tax=Nostoc sp. FACHB-145 TaxID=2692836 RepID=UPI00168972EF|nr:alpha-amylase [Nostoc sp. FACHB-145]MBD2473076.1 alpha-amylase [Nostoc sp. FACHB-145]